MSVSKKANSHTGRNRQTPAGVDGALLSSTEENGVDDTEVSLSLTIVTINSYLFIDLWQIHSTELQTDNKLN